MKRLAVRCWQSLKWLTSKADGCYGWRVLVESLHQTVVIISIQDMDQAVPASCGQQLQAWQWQDNLIIYRINSRCTNSLHLHSHNALTSFWFTVLKTEDLSIVGLHFQNLLHAAQGMNPAEYTENSHVFKGWRSPQSVVTLSFSLLVLPQHPIAISRCQVFAVWTHTDGSDARPAFCRLSVPHFVCIHVCRTFWIQQGTSVSIYVDYILQVLQSNDG